MMETVRAYAPGRTEIAGNHTDHQGGRVIAAAVDCGTEVRATANGFDVIRVASAGFDPFEIALDDLNPVEAERFTPNALVRGVVSGLRDAGVRVCGFDAEVESDIPAGSGLSSSAAFELALAKAACALAQADLEPLRLARIGQAAEHSWFGKKCGLMDQLSVALGGINLIDFAEKDPAVERIDFDFAEAGLALCLIDTHCDHSVHTEEYSRVARDMGDVAEFLGARVLSQVDRSRFFEYFMDVREALGDLPVLRAMHYYYEMRLVDNRAQAMRRGDVAGFLSATRRSSASSAQYLQNVSSADRREQSAMVALALADVILGFSGAARIHGGGFGGSVQAFVPIDSAGWFTASVDTHLGHGSCKRYRIVQEGARLL